MYWSSLVVCQCETVSPADAAAIAKTVLRAVTLFGTSAHKEMIQNCMAQDFSWKVKFNTNPTFTNNLILTFLTIFRDSTEKEKRRHFVLIYAGSS